MQKTNKYSFLNSLLRNAIPSSVENENRIIIKNPKAAFNTVKRSISFLIGFSLVYFLYKAFQQNYSIDSFQDLYEFIFLAALSIVFLFYAIFYSSVHKLCFIQFDSDKISGRLPVPLESYPQGNTFIFILMMNPKYEEFEFMYTEINHIKIELNKIYIVGNGKLDQMLDFSNLDYAELKSIKKKFELLQNKL